MPRVRFTAAPKLPRDWADRPYRDGWEGDLSDDEAARWVRRGVAEIVPAQRRPIGRQITPSEPTPEPAAEPARPAAGSAAPAPAASGRGPPGHHSV